ncbi:hypothetical protein QTP86_018970, partial [Hemibagrus guttatus]
MEGSRRTSGIRGTIRNGGNYRNLRESRQTGGIRGTEQELRCIFGGDAVAVGTTLPVAMTMPLSPLSSDEEQQKMLGEKSAPVSRGGGGKRRKRKGKKRKSWR